MAPLFQFFREVIAGPRGIIKVNEVWLPLAAAMASVSYAPAFSWGAALSVVAAVACWSQACILANDWADRAADAAAGKKRWITTCPPIIAASVILGLLVAGAAISARAGNFIALGVYLGACLLGLAYSFPPLALKKRGAWGHFGYAGAGALAFAVLPSVRFGVSITLTGALAAAVLLDKWVNLDFHQIVDFEADTASRTPTLAVRTGLARSRARLRLEAGAAAIALAAVAVATCREVGSGRPFVVAAVVVAFVGAALYAARARRMRRDQQLMAELSPIYLAAGLAVLRVAPAAFFIAVARARTDMIPLAGTAVVLMGLEMIQLARYRYR